MAITNHERVGKAMEHLKEGLYPFVERELVNKFEDQANIMARQFLGDDRINAARSLNDWDVGLLLRVMWEGRNKVFRDVLGYAERGLVSELRDVRNKWAHQENFSNDDTYRALDSTHRLLTATSAPQAGEVEKLKMDLLRAQFDEQTGIRGRGTPTDSTPAAPVESQVADTLKPWREVASPHPGVTSGKSQETEFAADLWQVHLGEGTDEYRDPEEFFRRTCLTESLEQLLVAAIQRLAGDGGDPVVQLQADTGGGKTHSMMALYHLFSGLEAGRLAGIDIVLEKAGVANLPAVNRVALVGSKISPAHSVTKPDGTEIKTLWGELAWQLGGRAAYERIQASDEQATNPGDTLVELFDQYGPCLVLIDDWVAYARQLHGQSDLPAGSFETQLSFAQTLIESAQLADYCLVAISLPASYSASPHARFDDAEVGEIEGGETLERLRKVIGRQESSWRPASAGESIEIVQRRLFEPLVEQSSLDARDTVARTFYDFYRSQSQEFPPECGQAAYEKRLRAAYPIHPEVFDRIYTDWATLPTFQHTRSVLRLISAVISCLWEREDPNPLIMPSSVPIDDPEVQFELTRYLSENWVPIIERDVDGPNSLPQVIDNEVPNLGRSAANRRVARTIYLGSAPTHNTVNRGVEDRRIKLGCVNPGESPAVFGDALRRLAGRAAYLNQDGPRYWYSTQATVTRVAEDRAEQFKRDSDRVNQEISRRLRQDLRNQGEFSRVHVLPQSPQDVADDPTAGLVLLGIDYPYRQSENSLAEMAADSILGSRGSTPRVNRNALVFLAADRARIQDLVEAVCRYLAWQTVLEDQKTLGLSPHQVSRSESQLESVNGEVAARIPETYQWLLVPTQQTPRDRIEWQSFRLAGPEPLAVRASQRLLNDQFLVTNLEGSVLRRELDQIPLWRGDHVAVRQLVEDFARYIYLPRLKEPVVLLDAIRSGLTLLTREQDSFAYADSYDDVAQRYRGLRCGVESMIGDGTPSALVVRTEVARNQLDSETANSRAPKPYDEVAGRALGQAADRAVSQPTLEDFKLSQATRFHGTVSLDPTLVGRDAGRIADEVVAHLAGLLGGNVKVTLEIEADIPEGTPEQVVHKVAENSRTLKFTSHSFEEE